MVDKIKAVATGNKGPHQNVPNTPRHHHLCHRGEVIFFKKALQMSNPQVELHVTINVAETATQGVITLELDAVNAPKSTANFLAYVNSGFYNGTRVPPRDQELHGSRAAA